MAWRRTRRTLFAVAAVLIAAAATAAADTSAATRLAIPRDADQLIVVSSPTDAPADYLASMRVYKRATAQAPWRRVFGAWHAETGIGHLIDAADRREGDYATPIGVFGFGPTMYGIKPNPGGLHYAYHQLVCGDWWDEDPDTADYNRFVHVRCGETPAFAGWSEALWTEGLAYPYMAVIRFNIDPTVSGPQAPGSGIFLHHWVDGPTEGCIALPEGELLAILRWLTPAAHPVIEIGTNRQVTP